MAVKQGLDKLPFARVPANWDREWFIRFCREVLALADTRNAINGDGVVITGTSDEPATISASADVLALIQQPYILAEHTALLPNERLLVGQSGFITATDGGADGDFTIGIDLAMDPIWTGTHQWENPLYGPLGTAALPSFSASQSRHAGLYFPDFNVLGLATNSTLWFQVGGAGQWGIGGATYGNAGDLYLSGGASAQPAWTAPAALTRTDDTNVTLTLGGSPTTALVNAASITAGWTGQLSETRGGTAQSTYATGDMLYASGSNTLAKRGIGAANSFLQVSGGIPVWSALTGLFANPSATYGADMTGANGSATTGLRSDAVMKIDPGIEPTWTGTHVFSGAVNEDCTKLAWSIGLGGGGTVPSEVLTLPSAGSGSKIVQRYFDGTNFVFRNVNDDFTASRIWLQIVRSGITVTSQIYGNSTDNPPHTFYGQITQTTNILAKTSTTYANGAAAAAGTLLNAPAAGNPTKWIPINDNGTTRYIPAW